MAEGFKSTVSEAFWCMVEKWGVENLVRKIAHLCLTVSVHTDSLADSNLIVYGNGIDIRFGEPVHAS